MTAPPATLRAKSAAESAARPAAWHIVSAASAQGSAPFNEDGAGARGAHAWIIDGSAFFTGPARLADTSEGAWLVSTIDRWLRDTELAPLTLPQIADLLDAHLTARDAALGPAASERGDGQGPTAVFALLRLTAEGEGFRAEAMLVGDVCVLIADRDRVTRWTDERAQPFEARTIAAASAAGRPEAGAIAPDALAQVIANRRSLNRDGGYWAIAPVQPWRQGLRTLSLDLSAKATLLLATDGFMRLVDMMERYDDGGLLAATTQRGAAAMIAELRDIEREDGRAERFARVKLHDDATALMLRPGRAGPDETTHEKQNGE